MIPKIIHYCWFGQKEIPEKHAQYISKWSEVFKGYKIIKWNEQNSPMHLPYMQSALQNKKWANLSNYTRLHAVAEHGGIYLDTDIEALKTFDALLANKCFVGFEDVHVDWDGCVNNAVLGAVPNHPFILEMKDRLPKEFDGLEEAHLSSPNFTTRLLKEKGLKEYKEQHINDVRVYPIEYFYPYSWHEEFDPSRVKENTYCIHRFEKSWIENKGKSKKDDRSFLLKFYHKVEYKIKRLLQK